ncbi:MAG: HEAT repeat domain-containing protein [Planctomycetota bacterium]
MRRNLLSILALLLASSPSLLSLRAGEPTDKEIKEALASPDSHFRHNVWKELNPEKDAHYKLLVTILQHLSWHDRDAAVVALAKAATPETLKKMLKDLKGDKDPMVRQGMAIALAKMDDEGYYPQLFEALGDKNPFVRAMLVYALGVTKKSKDKVDALVKAFQKEKDPVVASIFVEALNAQTQAFQGPDPNAWTVWWAEAKADKDYELGRTDEEALKKAEELGNKLKKRTTVSIAGRVTLETEERGRLGKAVPILVLPEYGHSKEVLVPFLAELEKTHRLFYIDLPPVSSFKDVPVVSDRKIPYYPIDQLVDAFEDLRKQTGQKRFAIMACGLNCWIAMRYASKYPGSVSHMVLIGPMSSDKAFGDAVTRMKTQGKATGDVELFHLGLAHSFDSKTGESEHDKYHEKEKIPKPDGEEGSLDRRLWSLYFKDARDAMLSMLYPKMHRPLGQVAIPKFRCFAEPKRSVPTIVIAGGASLWTSVEDCQAIANHYGGKLYVYENSSMMPFIEESQLFNKHMSLLLREASRRR